LGWVDDAVFAVVGGVLSLAWPTSHLTTLNALFAFTIPLGILYSISLLVTLSSRKRIRRKPTGVGAVSLASKPSIFTHPPPPPPTLDNPDPFRPTLAPAPAASGGGDPDEERSRLSSLLEVPRRLARSARSVSPPGFRESSSREGEHSQPPSPKGSRLSARSSNLRGVNVSIVTDVRTEWDEPIAGGERRSSASAISEQGAQLGLSMLASGESLSTAGVGEARRISFQGSLLLPDPKPRRESWQNW